MKQRTKLSRSKPLKRGTAPRRQGPRGAKRKADKRAAIELFFKLHGRPSFLPTEATCQMTGRDFKIREFQVDPCHKKRASQQGGEAPGNLVIALRAAHAWQSQNREAEDFLAACDVNAETGGVVNWPPHLKADLEAWLLRWPGPLPRAAA